MNKVRHKPDRLHFAFIDNQDSAQKWIFGTADKGLSLLGILSAQCVRTTCLFYGFEQILFVWSVGWDAAMAAELEGGHEHAHGVLLVFGEAVFVIVQHLVQVQGQLRPMLSDKQRWKRTSQNFFFV